MGTWGIGPFEDDWALDFKDELLEAADPSSISEAIAELSGDPAGYVDSDLATRVLVAGEVLAGQIGRGSKETPDELTRWAAAFPKPNAALVVDAREAVVRVLDDSELTELWADSPRRGEWQARTQDLIDRLG